MKIRKLIRISQDAARVESVLQRGLGVLVGSIQSSAKFVGDSKLIQNAAKLDADLKKVSTLVGDIKTHADKEQVKAEKAVEAERKKKVDKATKEKEAVSKKGQAKTKAIQEKKSKAKNSKGKPKAKPKSKRNKKSS